MIAAVSLAFTAAACGYHFVNTAPLAGDASLRRIAVPVFQNDTLEAGAESAFAGALRQELAAAGYDLVSESEADAVVRGRIGSVNASALVTPVTGGGIGTGEYRLGVVVELALVKPDGTVVWREPALAGSHVFIGGSAVQAVETGRSMALGQLATSMMRDARLRMIEAGL